MKETKEVKKETKKKTTKAKTKMKLWKKILIVIGIILLVFLIDIGRKFVIIRKIQNQAEKEYNVKNYYAKSIDISNGTMSQVWGYEDKYLFKQSSYNEKGLTEKMIYQDESNKELWIIVNEGENEKVAVKLEYKEDGLIKMIPNSTGGLPDKNDPLYVRLFCSAWSRITSEKWAGTDCYKIKFNDEFKIWVNKSTSRVIAELNGDTQSNGQRVPDIIIRDVNFNETKLEEVQLPDLTEYVITDKTNNVQ